MDRDEIAKQVAQELGLDLSAIMFSSSRKVLVLWDALISAIVRAESAELRVKELSEALREAYGELQSVRRGCKCSLCIKISTILDAV